MDKNIRDKKVAFELFTGKDCHHLKGKCIYEDTFTGIKYSIVVPRNFIKLVKLGCFSGPNVKTFHFDEQTLINDWETIPVATSAGDERDVLVVLINEIVAKENLEFIKIFATRCLTDRLVRFNLVAKNIDISDHEFIILVDDLLIKIFGCEKYLRVLRRLKELGEIDDQRIEYVEMVAKSN